MRTLLLFTGMCLPLVAQAQVNTESLMKAHQDPGWHPMAAANLAVATGNVDTLDLSGQLAVAGLSALEEPPPGKGWFRDRAIFHATIARRRVSQEDVVDSGFVAARYTRMVVPRVGPEFFAQAQYDETRLLQLRALGGVGVRAVAYRDEKADITGGTGYMAEYEVRDEAEVAPQPSVMLNHRWTSYLTTSLQLSALLEFTNTVYLQPRIDDFADLQVLEEGALKLMLAEHVTWTTTVQVRHDSRPPPSVAPTDFRLAQGIKLEW